MPGISRENSLRILRMKITKVTCRRPTISAKSSARAPSRFYYALRVLRHHGMTEAGLYAVFRAVVVSWLTYASPAWMEWIYYQRADAFLRRSKRCGFCPPDLPEFDKLLEESDDELFNKIKNNPNHTLHQFLPVPAQSMATQHYHLRHRTRYTR